MFAMSVLWFLLYLIDRLMQVKNVELSTPRGFNTVLGNFHSDSVANNESASTIKLTDTNVLGAYKTMNFHRTKMKEYLYDSFLHSRPLKPSHNNGNKKESNLIQDVGSNSYTAWLMRMISSSPRPNEGIYTRHYDALGYTKGHSTKPFYKVRDSAEDGDIYVAMSFPTYHVQPQGRHTTMYPSQTTYNRTALIFYPKIPMFSTTLQKFNRHHAEWESKKNIIGSDLYHRAFNLTSDYRKKFKTTLIPRVSLQQLSIPFGYKPMQPITEFISLNTTPMPIEENTIEANYEYITQNMNSTTEMSNRNDWMYYDNGESVLSPPTEVNNDTLGYPYSAPRTDSNMGTYSNNPYYTVFTEKPVELTYPPYYPPYEDANNGYSTIAAPYGYLPPTETTHSYIPPYGEWYPTQEPDNPSYGSEYDSHPSDREKYGHNHHHHEAEEFWYIDHPPRHNGNEEKECECGNEQEMEEMEDGRLSNISSILGPDGYELILTTIAFMAFGTYFMNMMMKITETNSAAPTMMIIGNGNDNVAPNVEDNVKKFLNDDTNVQLVERILLSIEEFQELLTVNRTHI